MKNKLPRKKEVSKIEHQEQQSQSKEELEEIQAEDLSFIPKMLKKQALFVTFTGMIQYGLFQEEDSLMAYSTIMYGPDWIRVSGDKSYISQIAASNGKEITWNFPFQVTFQTTSVSGWPQLVIALYGTDFFGRSFVKGYGNVHLPTQTGKHRRRIQIFRPLPQSTISGIFGFIGGVEAEFKDHQKILSSGDGREVTRVKSKGEVAVTIETMKHNFKKYGYE